MSIAVAQVKVGTIAAGTVTSISASFDATPATSSLIVVATFLKHSAASPPDITVSDNQGNTYAEKLDRTGTRARSFQHFVNGPIASGTFTVTATPAASTSAMQIVLYEITGFDTGAPDEAVNSQGSSGTAVDSLSVTPAGNALYIAMCTAQTTGQTITEESEGWTLNTESEGGAIVHSLLSKVGSGSINGNWTLGTGGNWAAGITAWKEAAAGGGRTTRNTRPTMNVKPGVGFARMRRSA